MARLVLWTELTAIVALLSSCAGATGWPPTPLETHHRIYVSLDTWHGMIGYQVDHNSEPSVISHPLRALGFPTISTQDSALYEEWGYAERRWYLEDRQGLDGILRALLWPTAGTVEVGRHDVLWASRTADQPADLFVFDLSEEGFSKLRRHLRATIAEPMLMARTDGSYFYPSVRAYHALHHCHHYVARALREAGLPVSSFGSITRTTLAWQLQRAERLSQKTRSRKGALAAGERDQSILNVLSSR